jgi:methylated-DNA-[protein]-cysteine S-methyltransferase
VTCYTIFPTPFGPVAVVWVEIAKRPRVRRVFLSKKGETAPDRVRRLFPGALNRASAFVEHLGGRITSFLGGADLAFELDSMHLDLCPPFQRRVLLEEHRISRGRVASYGRLAERVGSPKGARAVGAALAENPFPIIIPCHRAVRADGTVGGFQGGTRMKRALLAMEGISFDPRGKISAHHFIGP